MSPFPLLASLALAFYVTPPLWAQDTAVDAGRGPVEVHVPSSYNAASPMPLVMMLHGYRSSGSGHEGYMKLGPLSQSRGFIYVAPDGMVDDLGNQYWNATDACCDMDNTEPDDSAYLRLLIEAVQAELSVDPQRIYIVGHSNGAFMSYRMACDHADLIAAIAPLSGATFLNASQCDPSEPVGVLHMHGTRDPVIRYRGGCIRNCYPGAAESLEMWAEYNACRGLSDPLGRFDYDLDVEGEETLAFSLAAGCPAGGALELWRMQETFHMPSFSDIWNDDVIDWLWAHPKP